MHHHKPINIILQVHINYNSFEEDYQKNYLDKINKDKIRKKLNIPNCDHLKKNGGWQRTIYYSVDKKLYHSKVRIQKLQWTTKNGASHYISVWPNFIIKYNPLTTDLIELITLNIRKGEDIFSCIKDPECLVDCEDLLHFCVLKVNQACIDKNFSAILNANYTKIYGIDIKVYNFDLKDIRYPDLYLLQKIGAAFIGDWKNILSHLNYRFKFLR